MMKKEIYLSPIDALLIYTKFLMLPQKLAALSEDELHKLLLLNCEMSELVGKMIEAGLIEVEITEE